MEFDYDPKRAQEELIYLKEIEKHWCPFLKIFREYNLMVSSSRGTWQELIPVCREFTAGHNNLNEILKLESTLKKGVLNWKKNKTLDKILNRKEVLNK